MKAKQTSLVFVAVAVVAAVVVLALKFSPSAPEAPADIEVAPTPTAERAVPAGPRTAPLRATCSFQPGQRFAVDVREHRAWTIDSGLDPRSPFPASTGGVPATIRLGEKGTLRWRLDLAVVALQDDKTAIFVATVSRPRFHDGRTERSIGPAQITAPFLLRIGKRCDVLDVARREGSPMTPAYWQHRLVASLSWRLPPYPGKDVYDEVQRHAGGVYDAHYTVLRGERYTVIDRQITNVRELYPFDPGHRGAASTHVTGPGVSIEPGDRGWFTQLRRNEVVTYMESGVPYAKVDIESSAKAVAASAAPIPKIGDTVDGWVWGDLFAIRTVVLGQDAGERWQTLSVDSMGRVISDLLADAVIDPSAAVDIVRDWVRTSADKLPRLVDAFRADDGLTDAQSAVFALGLALSAQPPAINLLGGLLIDPTIGTAHRVRAVLALGGAPGMPTATVDQLVKLAQPGAAPASPAGKMERAAVAALGHIGRRQLIHDPASAQRAMGVVRDRFSTATTGDQLVTVLAGLENGGDDTFAPNLKDLHLNRDPQVRTALAQSLRRVNPLVAHQVWDQWIPAERDPNVRRAIAEALMSEMLIFRDETTALRSLRGPAIRIVGEQFEKGHDLARPAVQARLDAENRAKTANPSITGELEVLLKRFPEPH